MRSQELNLLIIFDTIMTEGSITRAADRLAMTQPAVSNAVSRMRTLWKDDLFIKDGRSIQPTLYARNLWDEIKAPIASLNRAVKPSEFQPEKSGRIFRVAAADGIVELAWPSMREIIEREAPGVALHAIPYHIINGEQLLNDAKVDIVIAPKQLMPSLLTSEALYEARFVCVMSPDNPLATKNLTLKRFADADHLLVSLSGDTTGLADHELARQNLKRRIAMTVNNFASAPVALKSSNMIAMLPSITVEKYIASGELVARPAPIPLPTTHMGVFWHPRQAHDPALHWLREKMAHTIRQQIALHEQSMAKFCS